MSEPSSPSPEPARPERSRNPWWIPPFLGSVPKGVEHTQLNLLGFVALAMFFENYDYALLTNVLKYLALVLESEYLQSDHRDEALNEIINRDLNLPLVSAWNKFLRKAIPSMKQAGHAFFVEELEPFYRSVEEFEGLAEIVPLEFDIGEGDESAGVGGIDGEDRAHAATLFGG